MESDLRLFSRKEVVDVRIWPIFHFISKNEVENIKLAVVFGDRGTSAVYVTKNDEVFAIGVCACNMLGNSEYEDYLTPKKVDQLCGKKIKYISFGYEHILGLTEDGILYSWGSNDHGELGTKKPNDLIGPSIVGSLFNKKVVQIACSSYYNVVLCSDNEIYEWGQRFIKGTGDEENTNVETLVEGEFEGKEIVCVACSTDASFALSSDGCVYSWGNDQFGILGMDPKGEEVNTAILVPGLSGIFINKIVTGREHVIALSDTGTLYSWGRNDFGQLGRGEMNEGTYYFLPEKIEFTTGRKIIDIGACAFSDTSAAMDENCKVFVWGYCADHSICSPFLTDVESLHEVFVFFANYACTFRPITLKNVKKALIYKHIGHSFNDEETSDLTISVEGKRIHVHKAVLRIRSNHFRIMLRNEWKENERSELEMKDTTYDAYKSLLEYFYTDHVDVPFNSAFDLLDLARIYGEEELKEMCKSVIKSNINIHNAASSYATSKKMLVEDLKTFCLKFMMHNFSGVSVSKDFKQLDAATILEILEEASRNYSVFKT